MKALGTLKFKKIPYTKDDANYMTINDVPQIDLLPFPDTHDLDQIKKVAETNKAIIDYLESARSFHEDSIDHALDREQQQLKIERERIETERVRAYHQRDYDFFRHGQGVFTLYDDVSEYSVKAVMADVMVWHNSAPEGAPLQLNINSYGGSVTDGFALFDTLRHIADEGGRKIKTVSLGITASMGGILLQAGDERVMAPSSVMLIHEISYGSRGNLSSHEDLREFADILSNRVADVFLPRANMSREEFLKSFKRRDWWLSPQQCLEYGFIDRIDYN